VPAEEARDVKMLRTQLRMTACLSVAATVQLICLQAHAQTSPAPPPPAQMPPPAPGGAYDAAPPPQLQQPMMRAPAGGPVVTLRADNPRARLQQMRLRWEDVCVTPCGVPADPSGVYRVGGGTIRPSEDFRLPRPSGPVLIEAQTGSTIKHWVGFGLTIGGGVSALLGVLELTIASNTTTDMYGNNVKDVATGAGIFYLVSAAVLLAVGIPLSMSSTSVDVR
jgi:hypothetical protein